MNTDQAPAAIGTYSQGMLNGDTLYVSGQLPLDPATGEFVNGDIKAHIKQVFDNLAAIAAAAGTSLDNTLKLNVFLTDLSNFAAVNEIMSEYFAEPYPARAAIGVASLPRGAAVEADAVILV
ncbi:MAG: Rid family detoxifying hydrolase [Gammaproteobacteria bacterium]